MLKKSDLSVLVIGSGGREHALTWKLSQSSRVAKMYVAPGNGGTASFAENVPIPVTNIPALVAFAQDHHIDLTVIGPDDVLAAGGADAFAAAGLAVFGPTQAAAQIEASKAFAKGVMSRAGVPTATFETFTDPDKALAYVRANPRPLVVKASGLALGKGVLLCSTTTEAEAAIKAIMLDKAFGEAGSEIVIETMLTGQEVSIHALSDGVTAALFPPSQDHKKIGEGDTGLNTGGMGAFGPVPWVKPELMEKVQQQVVAPALAQLASEGSTFAGCLYPGLMVEGGEVHVIEYNARFGDPETQVYMPLLRNDLVDVFEACLDQSLAKQSLIWRPGFAACVVLASGGYPEKYAKGLPISGLAEAAAMPNVQIFHAGTVLDGEVLRTAGGRVLNVVGLGDTLQMALDNAYAAIAKISFKGMYYRHDIGAKALA